MGGGYPIFRATRRSFVSQCSPNHGTRRRGRQQEGGPCRLRRRPRRRGLRRRLRHRVSDFDLNLFIHFDALSIFHRSTDLEDGGDSESSERERALGKLAFGEEEYQALVAEVKDVIGELTRDRDDTSELDI